MNRPNPADPYLYEVEPGEDIRFLIAAHRTPMLVKMALDGQPLTPPFHFTVTHPVGGVHIVSTEFDFPPNPDPQARYDIQLTGSRCGRFTVPSITPNSAVRDPGFTFLVVADSCPGGTSPGGGS